MLKKLSTKLILIIFLVGFVSSISLAFVQQIGTIKAILLYLDSPNIQTLQTMLAGYYDVTKEWESLDVLLQERDPTQFPPHGHIAILDTNGIIVYGEGPFEVGQSWEQNETLTIVPIMLEQNKIGSIIIQPPTLDWGSPLVQSFLTSIIQASIAGIVISSLVSLILATRFTRSIMRPIKALTDATRRIATGELEQVVDVNSDDELGELATSFNQMSHDLNQSVMAQRQMTADIAHDLRTPLSVILGYTEPLRDGKLTYTSELITIIHDEATHLSYLINDLLTLATADAGKLVLDIQLIQPKSFLEDLGASYEILASQQSVRVNIQVDSNLPFILVDPVCMTRVFNNLVMNALQHTGAGGEILLSAKMVDLGNRVVLEVSDTGRGIPENELQKIFKRFYRTDKSRTRTEQHAGTGLGLAIVQSLVKAHNGEIEVDSVVGQGTTFLIYLPAATD